MKTGWPPGLLQDDCRKLSLWFAGRLGARLELEQRMNESKIEAMAREAGDDWDATLQHDKDFLVRFHALALEQAAVICDKRAQHFEGLIDLQICAECLAFDIRAAKEKP